jgi:hypothetical protein
LAGFAQHVRHLEELDEPAAADRILSKGATEELQAGLCRVLGLTVAVEEGSPLSALGEDGFEITIVYTIDTNAVISVGGRGFGQRIVVWDRGTACAKQ